MGKLTASVRLFIGMKGWNTSFPAVGFFSKGQKNVPGLLIGPHL